MTPAEALPVSPEDTVLDLCAAPGGKSTQLACKLAGKGLLISNEVVKNRAAVLAQNMERMGVTNALILSEFPEKLEQIFPGAFDKILVDAPCSGEGMFRKNPAVLTEWSAERVTACAARQLKIMASVDKMLKPGGHVVYSTCTFAPEENEGVVQALLNTGRYAVVPLDLPGLSDHGNPDWISGGDAALNGTLRIFPHHVDGEGHFVALLEKLADADDTPTRVRLKKVKRPKYVPATKNDLKDFWVFVQQSGLNFAEDEKAWQKRLVMHRDELYLLPKGASPATLNVLKVVRPGLMLGTFKKNRFEPSHTLAMALTPEHYGTVLDLTDDDTAWAYLKGEPLTLSGDDKKLKGWTLVCYKGHALGFGKASGGVLKNHYPKGLRIMKK